MATVLVALAILAHAFIAKLVLPQRIANSVAWVLSVIVIILSFVLLIELAAPRL